MKINKFLLFLLYFGLCVHIPVFAQDAEKVQAESDALFQIKELLNSTEQMRELLRDNIKRLKETESIINKEINEETHPDLIMAQQQQLLQTRNTREELELKLFEIDALVQSLNNKLEKLCISGNDNAEIQTNDVK